MSVNVSNFVGSHFDVSHFDVSKPFFEYMDENLFIMPAVMFILT